LRLARHRDPFIHPNPHNSMGSSTTTVSHLHNTRKEAALPEFPFQRWVEDPHESHYRPTYEQLLYAMYEKAKQEGLLEHHGQEAELGMSSQMSDLDAVVHARTMPQMGHQPDMMGYASSNAGHGGMHGPPTGGMQHGGMQLPPTAFISHDGMQGPIGGMHQGGGMQGPPERYAMAAHGPPMGGGMPQDGMHRQASIGMQHGGMQGPPVGMQPAGVHHIPPGMEQSMGRADPYLPYRPTKAV
jgi:hypothetical protein